MKTKSPKRTSNISFTDLTLKSLKKHVITRGLEFDKVLSYSIPDLQNWLFKNGHLPEDEDLVVKYDDYIDQLLTEIGSDLVHPLLRLSYMGEKSENYEGIQAKPKKKKPSGERIIKEKTKDGIYSGTKKALTYQCFNEGKTIAETIEIVLEQFEDAQEKSIKIWFRKAGK